jgi:hypothetical protein
MYKSFALIATTTVLAWSTVASAHTLLVQCKKTTNQDVVCRAMTSDGEMARDVQIQLLATGDYRVLATGKTDAGGLYTFKQPDEAITSSRQATRRTSPIWQASISGKHFWARTSRCGPPDD